MTGLVSLPSVRRVLAAALLAGAAGCAPGPALRPGPATHGLPPPLIATAPAAAPTGSVEPLAQLFDRRAASATDGDYVLGEGDVLAIRAYDLEEMNQRVRIDGDGALTLPLVGTVPAAGQSVTALQQDLTKRLGEFMYAPHVTVFVEEYRSQQISVLGAVQRPGPVSQTARNTTVREALSAAGGTTAEAGSRFYLLPAEHRGEGKGAALEAGLLDGTSGVEGGEELTNAILVDTHEADAEMQRRFFNMPVRGGDVIIVPNRGRFIADGWVEKPGIYPLNPGLTLRGAIATAGGLQFPASAKVHIYRPGANGQTRLEQVNYRDVTGLRAPDVFIHDGDVVTIGASPLKLPPYYMYKLVADLFHLGAGVKVAP